MLLWFTEYLAQFDSGFNVFRYLTLRTILGVLTSLFVSFLFGPYLIRHLTKKQIGQSIRDDGPKTHLEKSGTPTMGGLLILISITFSTLCWADLNNRYIWVVLLVTMLFGVIGFIDDYIKLVRQDPNGLASRYKYFWQSVVGTGAAVFLFTSATIPAETELIIPFFKDVIIPLGGYMSYLPTLSLSVQVMRLI